ALACQPFHSPVLTHQKPSEDRSPSIIPAHPTFPDAPCSHDLILSPLHRRTQHKKARVVCGVDFEDHSKRDSSLVKFSCTVHILKLDPCFEARLANKFIASIITKSGMPDVQATLSRRKYLHCGVLQMGN